MLFLGKTISDLAVDSGNISREFMSTRSDHILLILSQRGKCSQGFLLAGIFFVAISLNGCAKMGATRSLPFTEFPPRDFLIPVQAKKTTLAVEPFDASASEVTGGHHEGLLQVRQPWIWGLSDEQKQTLYGNVNTIVRYAFIDELLKWSKKVVLVDRRMPARGAAYVISGSIQSVELNTYGQGTREGFGSAGNYWEAEIVLSDVSIIRTADNTTLWKGVIRQYGKVEGSPAKLNWTIFTVIAKSLQEGVTLSKGVTPGHLKEVVDTSSADYELEQTMRNPVEIAARLAAIDVLKLIFNQESRNVDLSVPH
jgi:hypothetical protein